MHHISSHSCDPNLIVFEVVYDQLPGVSPISSPVFVFYHWFQTGRPYHAYAAKRDIPAGQELVFDYNPNAAELQRKKKAKFKKTASGRRVPAESTECFCGADECRGFF